MNPEKQIQANILWKNNSPVDDFMGLSPAEMHELIYNTFAEHSPIRLKADLDDSVLDQIPLFRVAEAFMNILQRDAKIKLTPLGALPKKPLLELYAMGFLRDEHIESGLFKLSKEDNWDCIGCTRFTLEIAGLIKKQKGILTLTKKGATLLEAGNRYQLFHLFFQTFCVDFAWSSNDGFPEPPIAQIGWGFSMLLLAKYGKEYRHAEFYAHKYLKAFPMFIGYFNESYSTAERQFVSCHHCRTFYRFGLWFGFVQYEVNGVYIHFEKSLLKANDLLYQVFDVDMP